MYGQVADDNIFCLYTLSIKVSLNASSLTTHFSFYIAAHDNLLHPLNALSSIYTTEDGIIIDSNELHP